MAPHSSTLAWKIPWMEEPGGLQFMGSQRVRNDWATLLSLFTFMHWRRKWQHPYWEMTNQDVSTKLVPLKFERRYRSLSHAIFIYMHTHTHKYKCVFVYIYVYFWKWQVLKKVKGSLLNLWSVLLLLKSFIQNLKIS